MIALQPSVMLVRQLHSNAITRAFCNMDLQVMFILRSM